MIDEKVRQGFSIIVNCTDKVSTVEACLKYLVKNSRFNHQIILFGNASHPSVVRFIEESGYQYLLSIKPVVYTKAYNLSLDECNRELVLFYNETDIALPEWDTRIVETLEVARLRKLQSKQMIGTMTILGPEKQSQVFSAPLDYGNTAENFKYEDLILDLPVIRKRVEDYYRTAKPTSTIGEGPFLMNKSTVKEIGGLPYSLSKDLENKTIGVEQNQKLSNVVFYDSIFYSLDF